MEVSMPIWRALKTNKAVPWSVAMFLMFAMTATIGGLQSDNYAFPLLFAWSWAILFGSFWCYLLALWTCQYYDDYRTHMLSELFRKSGREVPKPRWFAGPCPAAGYRLARQDFECE